MSCGQSLGGQDLVPILSYLWLRGKCRSCGVKIPFRYLLVEILSGLIFAGLFFWLPHFPVYIFTLFFVLLLLVIFFTDLETETIPDQAVFGGIILGLGWAIYQKQFGAAVAAALLGYGFFFAVAKIAYWYYKKEAVGEGDFKLAAMLGAGLGWQGLFFAIFTAYVLGAAVSIFLVGLKIKTLKDNIPFGPFLAAGAVLFLFFGNTLLRWYFG